MAGQIINRGDGNKPLQTKQIASTLLQRRKWVCVALCGLYLLSYNGQWRITPDSANYLIAAKTFAQEGRLGHPLNVEDYVGPGFPLMMGYLIRLFGPEAFWAFDLALMVLVPVNLALVYWLIRLYDDQATAVVVTSLTAITHLFFSHSFYLLADWPFVTGVLLYLVGVGYLENRVERWRVWGLLILVGLTVMACLRSVFFVLPLATLIGLSVDWIQQRQFTRFAWMAAVLTVTTAVFSLLIPWSVFDWMHGDVLLMSQSLIERLPETLGRVASHGWWAFFGRAFPRASFGVDLGPWPNFALSVLLLAALWRLVRINVIWAVTTMGFMAQTLLFFNSRRYLLPVTPLLVYALWNLLCTIDRWPAARASQRRRCDGLVTGVFWFWVTANLIKIAGFTLEQRAQPFLDHYGRHRYQGFVQACELVRQHTPGHSLVVTKRKWTAPLTYLTDRLSVDDPTRAGAHQHPVFAVLSCGDTELASLELKGWHVERQKKIPISPSGPDDLWLAPVRHAVGPQLD